VKRRNLLLAAAALLAWTALGLPMATSASAGGGQSPNGGISPAASSPLASTTCNDTITKGSGDSALSFCITPNGNIVQLSFRGVEQIRLGNFTEGYLLCAGGAVKGYDLASFGESGFQAPTRTQPGGVNTLPLTIKRVTTDGTLSIAQTYSSSGDSVSITTVIKNLTGAKISAVKYARVVDFDDSDFSQTWSRSTDALTANEDGATGALMGTSTYVLARTLAVATSIDTTTCSPAGQATPFTGDAVGVMTFDLVNLVAGATKTTGVVYRRF
jgi:hypothetical protein